MAEEKYVPRLKTKYNNEVKQQLQDKFQYENVMMIPKFEKIVVNMGVGEAATDSRPSTVPCATCAPSPASSR